MPSLSGTFTADGQTSATLYLRSDESASYSLVNSFTGTMVLERSLGGQSWEVIRVFFATIAGTIKNHSPENWTIRLRCVDLAGGVDSIDYTLADVDGDKLFQALLKDGREALSVTDEGDLYVLGTLFSGGGGGSVTIQTDAGTYPVGSIFTFVSSDSSIVTTGDETTDEVDFVVDPAAGALATALGLKAPKDSPTFTTKTTHSYATASRVPYFNASKELVASTVSDTVLGYLDATSSIQTQLNAKAALDSPTFTTKTTHSYATASTLASFNGSKELVSAAIPLSIANGGTNSITALNNNRVMVSSGSAVVEATAITANRLIQANASGVPVHSPFTIGGTASDPTLQVVNTLEFYVQGTLVPAAFFNSAGSFIMEQTSQIIGVLNSSVNIDLANTTNRFRDLYLKGGITITAGANKRAGTATLSGGTVTVSNTAVTASSLIFVQTDTPSGTVGVLSVPVASITASTSFVINSSSGTDASTVHWFFIN